MANFNRFRTMALAVAATLTWTALAVAPSDARYCLDAPSVESASYGVNLDQRCLEYYKEPAATPRPDTAAALEPAAVDVWTLHSRPESTNIIYLDFDGYTWPAGAWWEGAWGLTFAGRVSPGYNAEGDPGTFTATEQSNIYAIWESIAEDFAVFDVDVTTELPTGSRAAIFAQRGAYALILSDATLQQACGCGGIAYVDVFEYDNPETHPSLNFTQYNGFTPPAWDAAEIAAHEIGHNLGLLHDGTTTVEYYGGQAMWTPIMGAGRGAGIATWSYGGYPDAVTRGTQAFLDDYATIARYLPLLSDLEPNTSGSAVTIPTTSDINAYSGRIETDTDVDWFKFTVPAGRSGTWRIDLASRGYAPNLDPELTLWTSGLASLGLSNPLAPTNFQYSALKTGLDAQIVANLAAGTYYLKVDGVGQGSLSSGTGYDDYASRGNYQLILSAPGSTGPTLSSFSPTSGGRGTAVLLTGSGFNGASAVKLGATGLAFTVLSDTQLVAAIPNGAVTGRLAVTAPTGTVTAASNFTVTRTAAARSISGFTPTSAAPGSEVTVTGNNLGASTAVRLGNLAASFRITAVNQLVFTIPANAATGRITITTAGGSASSSASLTVLKPPTISRISPTRASIGTTVTITGTNLTGASITVGGVSATKSTNSATSIRFKVPAGLAAGVHQVRVTTSIGTATINLTVS